MASENIADHRWLAQDNLQDGPIQNIAYYLQLLPLTGLIKSGLLAARPAFGHVGAFYYATDTNTLYFDSGSAWVAVSNGSGGAFPFYVGLGGSTGIIGNGSADDSGAIGTYWGTLPAGSQIYFPNPSVNYNIANPITPPPGILTVMGGGDASLFNITADGITALTLTAANNRSSWARICFQLATTAPTSMALELNGVFNNDFDRISIYGQKVSQATTYDGQIGVWITNNSGDNHFRAATIRLLGIGVVEDCEQNHFDDCYIDENKVNLFTFGAGAGVNVLGGICKGSSNTAGASTSDFGYLYLGQGHHQGANLWCEAVNTACMQVGQNATASTTLDVSMNGLSLPQRTITVASTTGFPKAGVTNVATGSGTKTICYVNTDSTHFYGCVGGSGTLSTGGAVSITPVGPAMCNVPSMVVNGGAKYGLDIQKGHFSGGGVNIGSPGTFTAPYRFDGTNSAAYIAALDATGVTSSTFFPASYLVSAMRVGSSPGQWIPPASPPALNFVNETFYTETSQSATGTVTPANTAGNLLALCVSWRTTGLTVISVADTGANLWSPFFVQAGIAIYYSLTTAVAGTVTVTMSSASCTKAISCIEVIGAAGSTDKSAFGQAASSTATATTPATTYGNEIALAWVAQQDATATFSAQTAGYTALSEHVSTEATHPLVIQGAYLVLTTTGAQTYGLSSTSSAQWLEQIGTFKGY